MFLLFLLIHKALTSITILGPKSLSSSFPFPLDLEYANFGETPSSFRSHGEIFIDNSKENKEGCEPFSENFISEYKKIESEFPIFLLRRGGCSFVTKARNSQNAGAQMLIVINNNNDDIHDLIMSDDGTGGDIYIPSALISLSDGNKIFDFLKKKKFGKISVEVDFNFEENEENEEIQIEFFFSSHEEKAYDFIQNISNILNEFNNDKISFIPRYVTHKSPKFNKENPVKIENCFSKGKYCYFPKWSNNVAKANEILIEDLRQKCIFNLYNKRYSYYYFDYMEDFYKECYNGKFNSICSNKILKNIGIKVKEIENCISDSFGMKKYNDINFDNENVIFEDEYSTITNYGLTNFPSVTINTVPIEGIIKIEKLIIALCDMSYNKPEFCNYFYENNKNNGISFGYWFFIILLLIVFVIIVIGLFYFCKNYITTRVHQRVYSEGIDLDGRINNAIANYFTLKESGKI
jgi:hypothetical protein